MGMKFNVSNPDTVIEYLDSICEQGKAESGVHLERASSMDPWSININDEAFYISWEMYDRLRAMVSIAEVWR